MTVETKNLSPLDMAFFLLETNERMSNIGPIAILRPPAGTRSAARFADQLMSKMKKRPVGMPFNFRYQPPGLQGLPRLVSVNRVDLDKHCHRVTLPKPGTDQQLFEAVCRIHEKRLDRSRPPWAFYIFDGLQHGRIAIYAKVHHGLIDGRGFVEVCTSWFTDDPDNVEARAIWDGLPKRGSKAVAAGPLNAVDLADKASDFARTAFSLYKALARQALSSAKMGSGLGLPFLGTPSVLRARPSVKRSFSYCVLPLAEMKALGKAHDASINDVLLTVLDMALGKYLGEKSISTDGKPFVVDMPVALGKSEGGGNSIAVLQIPLGSLGVGPLDRLKEVCRRSADVKHYVKNTETAALVAYTAAVHGVPAILETLGIERGPMLANMMISNPFGLPEKRWLAGAELEMALPVSVLAPGQALNVTAATYDQGLQLAFLGLASELPDIQRLAELTLSSFERLSAAARALARQPGPAAKKPAGKKPAIKKTAAKKAAVKKAALKTPTEDAPARSKPEENKPTGRKRAARKPVPAAPQA